MPLSLGKTAVFRVNGYGDDLPRLGPFLDEGGNPPGNGLGLARPGARDDLQMPAALGNGQLLLGRRLKGRAVLVHGPPWIETRASARLMRQSAAPAWNLADPWYIADIRRRSRTYSN